MSTTTTEESWRQLSTVAHLLHHAATSLWERAEQPLPDTELQSFGLAVYLARSQAIELVPLGYRLPQDDEGALDVSGQTVLELLVTAGQYTRSLPLHRPDRAAGELLIVDLCDLVREARDLGL